MIILEPLATEIQASQNYQLVNVVKDNERLEHIFSKYKTRSIGRSRGGVPGTCPPPRVRILSF